jgi:hypothetical protein
MRPASARKTASCGNGLGEERGRANPPISATTAPIVGAELALPFADTEAMQLHREEISSPPFRLQGQRRNLSGEVAVGGRVECCRISVAEDSTCCPTK